MRRDGAAPVVGDHFPEFLHARRRTRRRDQAVRQHVAVDHLDLAVPEGAIYGFIGPNGSGKTTTLRMILRILYPTKGACPCWAKTAARRDDRVGYLPEERGLYKRMRVRDLLAYFARLKGFLAAAARSTTGSNASGWPSGPTTASRRFPRGWRRRSSSSRRWWPGRGCWSSTSRSAGSIRSTWRCSRTRCSTLHRAGTTVIFSTHDMDIAERMCDTIFMIYRGRKVLDGTLEAIQDRIRPGHDPGAHRRQRHGAFEGLPGVRSRERLRPLHGTAHSNPAPIPQAILRELLRRTRVEHFEIARPSLHDIFLRIAGPEAAADRPRDRKDAHVRA